MKEFIYLERNKRQSIANLAIIAFFSILVLVGITPFVAKINFFSFLDPSNEFFLKQLIPFFFAFMVLILSNKLILKRPNLKSFTSNVKFSWKKCFISFGAWILLLSILLGFQMFNNSNNFVFNFQLKPFLELFFISIVFVAIQAVFEELLFRSFILQSFGAVIKNKLLVVCCVSLLFTSLHLDNPEVRILGKEILIYYFLTSVFLSIIAILDQGIELTIGFHAANNLFGSVILTNNWQVFQTKALLTDMSPAKISWDIWIILLFLYPVLIVLYLKLARKNFGSIFDSTIS